MNKFVFLFILLIISFAEALSFEEALIYASQRPDVINARIELQDAESNFHRASIDPLAVRPDKLAAEQRLELARADLTEKDYAATKEIAEAYTDVLNTRDQVNLAQKAVVLSQQSLNIAEIRVANGSIPRLDLEDAQVDLSDSQKDLQAAQGGLEVAEQNLKGILGGGVDISVLSPIVDSYLVLPTLEQALAAYTGHPDLIEARHGLESAEMQVDILDPSYTPRSQIDDARSQLDNARESVQEAQRGYDVQVRNFHSQADNARTAYDVARSNLTNETERLSTQRQRLDGGIISEIDFSQAELNFQSAQNDLNKARNDYLVALLDLQEGAMLSITGTVTANIPQQTTLTPNQ